jgi:hypothetical protein
MPLDGDANMPRLRFLRLPRQRQGAFRTPTFSLGVVGSGRILRSLLRLKSEQVYGVEFA